MIVYIQPVHMKSNDEMATKKNVESIKVVMMRRCFFFPSRRRLQIKMTRDLMVHSRLNRINYIWGNIKTSQRYINLQSKAEVFHLSKKKAFFTCIHAQFPVDSGGLAHDTTHASEIWFFLSLSTSCAFMLMCSERRAKSLELCKVWTHHPFWHAKGPASH